MQITRRGMMAGLGALGAAASGPMSAFAQAARPAAAIGPGSVAEIIAAADLGGEVSYVVVDPRSGAVLESRGADRGMAPASTAKAITTLYALETLGSGFRFATRLLATGPISSGKIRGDLILAGGGDPTLSTDDLQDMARQLAAAGVGGVTGRFLVWGGALPYAEEITGDQPVQVGYNPAISGLNLNFNRVHFEWRQAQGGYALMMDARGSRAVPRAFTTDMKVAGRENPLFTYRRDGGKERWTVASAALGRGGSRWLPVRDPVAYAGDIFQTLARAQGVTLPAPVSMTGRMPAGAQVLVTRGSEPLTPLLRDMLRHSTNLTAETVGMTATARRGQNAARGASGAAMSAWLKDRLGGGQARFVDHSGLGAETRISAMEMTRAVALLGPGVGLRGLMRPFDLRDGSGRKAQDSALRVDAKTGTLNFVSTLTGYLSTPGGRELVFTIFTGDIKRRARFAQDEDPPGARGWVGRSKILQSRLLERWGTVYAG